MPYLILHHALESVSLWRQLTRRATRLLASPAVAGAAAVFVLIAAIVLAVVVGDGPSWIVKSRGLDWTGPFKEFWTWMQSMWGELLPPVIVLGVLGVLAALWKMGRGHHEAHGEIGKRAGGVVLAIFLVPFIG